jgi:OFA family oxalate/formate antiporter-like MFS transporter
MFVLAATAGLMTIGNVKSAAIAIDPVGATAFSTIIVGVMSLFNAAGRIVWGALSDKLGREKTMILMFVTIAIAMFLFAFLPEATNVIKDVNDIPISADNAIDWPVVTAVASLVGFCFGGNFALFPSATADFFGSKNVGKNYGVMFTAYGIAGITGALVAGPIVDFFGSYFWAFIVTGILAIIAVLFTVVLQSKRKSA